MKSSKMLSVVILFLLGVVGVLGYLLLGRNMETKDNTTITSFDECVAAGYPVTLSYPGNCVTPDGRSFTQEISDEIRGEIPEDITGGDTSVPGSDGGVACTMEAKQCPDGSYVGRSGPNCEFTACPGR